MAHHAEAIPWWALAAHMEPHWGVPNTSDGSSLRFRRTTAAADAFDGFIDVFTRTLQDDSSRERERFKTYEAPEDDDVILDDELVKRISPKVHNWLVHFEWDELEVEGFSALGSSSYHRLISTDIVPLYERKAAAFIRKDNPLHVRAFSRNSDYNITTWRS